MAVRTTSDNVKEIITVETAFDLTVFITAANELVTECCSGASYSVARLELIERNLAAHFYTNYDPRTISEKAGPVSEKFQSKIDLGISTSHYGQTAMLLDTAGGLAALNERMKKGKKTSDIFTWLGKEETEVTDE